MTESPAVLLFSYAFPPIKAQMTTVVAKTMAGFHDNGYTVDVLCTGDFTHKFSFDKSLVPFVEEHFGVITRLDPPCGLGKELRKRLRNTRLERFLNFPDAMMVMHHLAFDALMAMNLDRYRAVITWSPYQTVNPVMVRLKKHRPQVNWIVQFSDPWVGNHHEQEFLHRLWSARHEPRTIHSADFIVHNSEGTRDHMMKRYPPEITEKMALIPHPFAEDLFPGRPRLRNDRIILRHVGALWKFRLPDVFFLALARAFDLRPGLSDRLVVELVGQVSDMMLQTSAARALPEGTLRRIGEVDYLKSLELMYDADALVLIEEDIPWNLFVPSKLIDYLGANRPIVAITPPGSSEGILRDFNCLSARPGDIDGIARNILRVVDQVETSDTDQTYDTERRAEYRHTAVAKRFIEIVERLNP